MTEEKTEQQVLEESVTDPGQFDEIVNRYYSPLCYSASISVSFRFMNTHTVGLMNNDC